ncbi:hypothetical protein KGQ34_04385, partial [Patescibacteria group bacterium]|nr:hypothetical protein [Patescibacteria group bacterium]
MAKTKMTIEQLARMVKRGFDQAATKDDLRNFATKDDLRDFRKDMIEGFDHINAEIRDIKIVLGPLVRMVAAQE